MLSTQSICGETAEWREVEIGWTRSTIARTASTSKKDATVLILGGGVAGVIAARTLHERGHDNFIIVDARTELGGRMQSYTFGEKGNTRTIELGPNWVQGTQTGDGPANPILLLAEKHGVKTQFNDLFGSLSEPEQFQNCMSSADIDAYVATYDFTGAVDYLDLFNTIDDDFTVLTVLAGKINFMPNWIAFMLHCRSKSCRTSYRH